MPSEKQFDPYHRWLGIAPPDQPPNHYRLLGIALFERDADVIDEAAQRQSAHIRKHLAGPQALQAKALLKKIDLAQACLLNRNLKTRYDVALKSQLPPAEPLPPDVSFVAPGAVGVTAQPMPAPSRSEGPAALPFSDIVPTSNHTARRRKSAHRSTMPWPLVAGAALVAMLALGGAVWWFSQGALRGETRGVSHTRQGTNDSRASATARDSTGNAPPMGVSQTEVPAEAAPTLEGGDHRFDRDSKSQTPSLPPALEFDGRGQYVALGNAAALNIEGPITLSAWVRPQATNGIRNIVAHGFSNSPAAEVYLRIHTGQYAVGSWDGGNHLAVANMPPSDIGTWVHLAGVYDGTQWKLFRNGALLATQLDGAGAVRVNVGWAIGAAGAGADRHFQGGLADVRIYRRGLSDSEVRRLYTLPSGVAVSDDRGLSDGLAGAWSLDSSSGVAVDSSTNHNDGKLVGGPRSTPGPRDPQAGSTQLVRGGLDPGPSNIAPAKPPRTARRPAPVELPQPPARVSQIDTQKVEPAPDAPPADFGANDRTGPAALAPATAKPSQGERVPVPSAEDQDRALALVKAVFKDAYAAAKKPEGRQALAMALAQQAEQSNDDLERYVLLTQASSAALASGDIDSGLDLVRRTVERYTLERWPALVEAVEACSRTPGARKALAPAALALADEALTSGDSEAAQKLLDAALTSAKKSGEAPLLRQITQRSREVSELIQHNAEFKAAGDTLAASPNDAAANLIVGKHLCLVNDWTQALPHLVKGNDKPMSEAAERELAAPEQPTECLALAELWWQHAQAASGLEKTAFAKHAESWYRQALPGLTGLVRVKADKRLEEIAALGPKEALAARGEMTARPVPATDRPTGLEAGAKPGSLTLQIKQALRAGNLSPTPIYGNTRNSGSQSFEEIPPAGLLLVGFNGIVVPDQYVRRIQAVYSSSKETQEGNVYGGSRTYNNDQPFSVIAKKGYAVGGLEVYGHSGSWVYAFEVIFMKITKQGLDANDRYNGERINSLGWAGSGSKTLAADGRPVIGIFGRHSDFSLDGLGLIQPGK